MHELAVTKSILKLALDHAAAHGGTRILSIYLVIGELRNLEEEWIQNYFDYISKGTPAENAKIRVCKVPVVFQCKSCGKPFTPDLHSKDKLLCLHCGSADYDLTSGRELTLEKVEIC